MHAPRTMSGELRMNTPMHVSRGDEDFHCSIAGSPDAGPIRTNEFHAMMRETSHAGKRTGVCEASRPLSMPTIAVLMGGRSAEREISLQTGSGVRTTLEDLGYSAYAVDYDDRFVDSLRERRPDAAFIALHGGAGEDGSVQAVLEWLRIPYQGSGVRASAIAMDKWMTKALMRAEGIPTPQAAIVDVSAGAGGLPQIPADIGCPCVVKPADEGSSVGVHIISEQADWEPAMRDAGAHSARVLVERYVGGR